jgi:hypothetical protein
MSTPKNPLPAKLLIGFFMQDKDIFHELIPIIEEKLGGFDIISPWFGFDYTDYYEKEMGNNLFRRIIVFKDLIEQENLAKIKNSTNLVEKLYEHDGKRKVNIDPGYMLPSRFILATGKDYSHRIYIGENIYADLTLIYKNGDYQSLEWTYPDYAARDMRDFLLKVRGKYLLDLAA